VPSLPRSDKNDTSNSSPATDQGNQQFLAMGKADGKFYDVNGSYVIDILCQYQAPAPCPAGYRLYIDSSKTEHGLSSCIKVFAPDTYDAGTSECGNSGGSPKVYQLATYNHLATFSHIDGIATTPLVTFVKSLATLSGIVPGNLYWTGALIQAGVVSWGDNRVFDSVVQNPNAYTADQIASDSYVVCVAPVSVDSSSRTCHASVWCVMRYQRRCRGEHR
jgi:hypothetical protein